MQPAAGPTHRTCGLSSTFLSVPITIGTESCANVTCDNKYQSKSCANVACGNKHLCLHKCLGKQWLYSASTSSHTSSSRPLRICRGRQWPPVGVLRMRGVSTSMDGSLAKRDHAATCLTEA
jgi:hypothetical protein